MRIVALGLALALMGCAQEAAQAPESAAPPPQAVPAAEDHVYLFRAAGEEPVCVLRLAPDGPMAGDGFYDAWLSGGCEGTFSFLMVLSGWEALPGGGIRLIGAEGSTMGDFTPQPDGTLAGVVENDGRGYTLQKARG